MRLIILLLLSSRLVESLKVYNPLNNTAGEMQVENNTTERTNNIFMKEYTPDEKETTPYNINPRFQLMEKALKKKDESKAEFDKGIKENEPNLNGGEIEPIIMSKPFATREYRYPHPGYDTYSMELNKGYDRWFDLFSGKLLGTFLSLGRPNGFVGNPNGRLDVEERYVDTDVNFKGSAMGRRVKEIAKKYSYDPKTRVISIFLKLTL